MKKAKIMLGVLTVLAIAGGALAVKASRATNTEKGNSVILWKWNKDSKRCDDMVVYMDSVLTSPNMGNQVWATTDFGKPCTGVMDCAAWLTFEE